MMIIQLVIIVVWNNIAYWIYKSIFPPRKMLLVHGDRPIESIVSKFKDRKDKYDIVKYIHVSEGLERVYQTITEGYARREFQAVVIWDIPAGAERPDEILLCPVHPGVYDAQDH